MMSNRHFAVVAMLAVAALFMTVPVQAASVNLGTGSGNGSNWLVDVYSDLTTQTTSAVPAIQTGNYISITSNDLSSGTFIAGSSNSTFGGLWTATETFTVPGGATGVNLSLTNLIGDDRVVLLINGTQVAATSIGGTGSGVQYFPTTGSQAVTYGASFPVDLTSYVDLVGTNTLELIVNNTNSDLNAAPRNLNGTGDATDAFAGLTLSYNTGAIPEPMTLSLFGTALVGFFGWRRMRQA